MPIGMETMVAKKDFIKAIMDDVAELNDPRDDSRTSYPIHEIILLALAATVVMKQSTKAMVGLKSGHQLALAT